VVLDEPAVVPHDQGGGAAHARWIIGGAGQRRDRDQAVLGHALGIELVISNEIGAAGAGGEGGHAVVAGGHESPVAEGFARARKDAVMEASGQVEDTRGVGHEVTITGMRRAAPRFSGARRRGG
jgi:hypothetical protein